MSSITPEAFLDALTVPVWQAMAAVRWLEGRVPNHPKADEITPEKAALTDADCVSQEILLVAARAAMPDIAVFVEEDTPSVDAFAGNGGSQTLVIDPIDGTLRYLCGDGPYAILVGLERDGRVDAALVALPQDGLLLRARRGGGAEIARDGGSFAPLRVPAGGGAGADEALILVSYGLATDVRGRIRAQGLHSQVACGGALGVASLLPGVFGGLRVSRAREGLSRRAWVAALPALEAGASVAALDGPFPETWEPGVRGVLVGRSPEGVAQIRRWL